MSRAERDLPVAAALGAEMQARTKRDAAARDAAQYLLQELKDIANADVSEWGDPSEFQAWAQNRARAAIAKFPGGVA